VDRSAQLVTDILGVSGPAILRALADGETDPERLAEMARRRLRGKIPMLREALRAASTLERFCPTTKHDSGRGDCEDGGGLNLEKGKGLTPMERLRTVSPPGPSHVELNAARIP